MSLLMRRGLLVAAAHVAIVSSLGGKLLVDRATRPRVWVRAAPVDPSLPIRGRYVSLRLEASIGEGVDLHRGQVGRAGQVGPVGQFQASAPVPVALAVRDQQLVVVPPSGSSSVYARAVRREGTEVAVLDDPVAYFIPEHVTDPSRRSAGEELWVEVTIPRRGGPRPIRLGVKKNGALTLIVS